MGIFSGLFSSPPKPKPPPPPPSTDSTSVQNAAANEQIRAALSKGASSTILAGNGLGNVG